MEELCTLAGLAAPAATPCSAHALEDQPVRYLRAARILAEEPQRLEELLCELLDAFPADGCSEPGSLHLDDGDGPAVALTPRYSSFTDTEVARARELRRLVPRGPFQGARTATVADSAATLAAGSSEPVPAPHGTRASAPAGRLSIAPADHATHTPEDSPVPPGLPVLRAGLAQDLDALTAMHLRCSAETVYRRYHAHVGHLAPRMARALLVPPAGVSMLLTVGPDVVAVGMFCSDEAAEQSGEAELGLMVEDAWQRGGQGARLLRALAVEAANRGLETLRCMVQPDNEAMLRTIRRAGLRARAILRRWAGAVLHSHRQAWGVREGDRTSTPQTAPRGARHLRAGAAVERAPGAAREAPTRRVPRPGVARRRLSPTGYV